MKTYNQKKVLIANLLKPLWVILGFLLKNKIKPADPKSILIMDVHLIGDLVTLTPLVAAAKKRYPNADICLIAGPWAKDVFRNFTEINTYYYIEVPWVKYDNKLKRWSDVFKLILKLRKKRWDLALDIRGDVRHSLFLKLAGAKWLVSYSFMNTGSLVDEIVPHNDSLVNVADYHKSLSEYLGIWELNKPYRPFLKLSNADINQVKDVTPYIGLHFGGSLPLKRPSTNLVTKWLDEILTLHPNDTFYNFLLREDVLLTNFIKNYIEQNYSNIKLITWEGSLTEFMQILSKCKHLYCCDSGPSHIAAALGVKVTAMYGPTRAKAVSPKADNVTIIKGPDVPCRSYCDQRVCTYEIHQGCMPVVII